MRSEHRRSNFSAAVLAIVAVTLALTPAVAGPGADADEYPDVAFLARNDVPFDAQTAASMAAQLGAPIFITDPNVLADAARDGIAGLNPDVIIVAGGLLAISKDVADAAAGACDPDCTVDRYAGAGRDETAADLAGIADKYGFDRPVLQGSNQVVGDVHVGGTVNADAITVQDTGLVSGLNADQLDGLHASAFARTDHIPIIEIVPGTSTSSSQPPDPFPQNSLVDVFSDPPGFSFTTTATGRLHITFHAVFDEDCHDNNEEWAWLVRDGTPIRNSAIKLPADGVDAIHHTLTGVTTDPVPAGGHTVEVHAGTEGCGSGSASWQPYATGSVIVLGD